MAKSRVDDIWGAMDKHYGDDFLKDREALAKDIRVVPTGSYVFDDALGVGGLPSGRIIQFAGKESSGKTFMALQAIKQWQLKDPENWAYFIDAEYTFDDAWALQLGLDLDRVKVFPTNYGVDIFTSLCGVPHKEPGKPKIKPGLLDIVAERGQKEGVIGSEATGLGLIVLDSIAAVQPPMEAASVSGKNNMALMGRFLPPELRKLTPLLARTGVSLIAINQVRVNPGQLYGNPETTTGGSAWKHYCSVMVNFGPIKSETDASVGHRIKARIDKNKVAPPKKTCEFDIEYLSGIANVNHEVVELGIKYGVVVRPNNKSYEYDGEKTVGKDNFAALFVDDAAKEKLLMEIKEAKKSKKGPADVGTEEDE